jgi:mannose-6-phosphate isomerase-like protein (cupin superfamily)
MVDPAKLRTYPVDYVLITVSAVELDVEPLGRPNKLAIPLNKGRKHVAIEVMPQFEEFEIRDPLWRPPAVLSTSQGGFEVATLTEFTGQDRHKHERATEIYTVLRGEFRMSINDGPPLMLRAWDEIVVLPGTVHEVMAGPTRPHKAGEQFDLLVRVHAIGTTGAADKFVQLEHGGPWHRWNELGPAERARAYRKSPSPK